MGGPAGPPRRPPTSPPWGRVVACARAPAAARTLPRLRRRDVGREPHRRLVAGRAVVGNLTPRGGLAALVGAHRRGTDAAAADRTATGHGRHSCQSPGTGTEPGNGHG